MTCSLHNLTFSVISGGQCYAHNKVGKYTFQRVGVKHGGFYLLELNMISFFLYTSLFLWVWTCIFSWFQKHALLKSKCQNLKIRVQFALIKFLWFIRSLNSPVLKWETLVFVGPSPCLNFNRIAWGVGM